MQLPSQVLRRSRTKWTSMGVVGRGWEPPLPSACRAFLTLIVIRSLHLRRREMSNSRSNLSAGIYYLSYRLARCFFVGGNEARERKERGSGSKANARRLMARLYSPPILVDTRLGYLQCDVEWNLIISMETRVFILRWRLDSKRQTAKRARYR